MLITVAPYFMSPCTYLPDKFRVFFSNPANDEKGCFYVLPVKGVEDILGIVCYPGLIKEPVIRVYLLFKSCDLEIVFHVYGEVIGYHVGLV